MPIKTRLAAITATLAVAAALPIAPAHAGPEPFLGELMRVGFSWCPQDFAKADGQLLQISQNAALYSLLGVTYGGDGRTTFGLPDLNGGGQGKGNPPAGANPDKQSTTWCIAVQGVYPPRP